MIRLLSKLLAVCLCAAGLTSAASAATVFTLNNVTATTFPGNFHFPTLFFEVTGAGVTSGPGDATLDAVIGGSGAIGDGWTVTISWPTTTQPVISSAFIKAGNHYLFWDATDLAGFNSGTYDQLVLVQNGITNPPGNAYLGISHAGVNGTLGTTPDPGPPVGTPDGGTTLALLGSSLLALGFGRRLVQRKAVA